MGEKGMVCPVQIAGMLDTKLRKLVHNPEKIFRENIRGNERVLDFGCGPGFFTIGIAKMLCEGGVVVASDIQEGMLKKVEKKVMEEALADRVVLHRHKEGSPGLDGKFDLIVAFYMIHEVKEKEELFRSFYDLLKTGGKLFICEPKMHVSGKSFESMSELLEGAGFRIAERPKVFFSRAVVAEK